MSRCIACVQPYSANAKRLYRCGAHARFAVTPSSGLIVCGNHRRFVERHGAAESLRLWRAWLESALVG